jgi:hypothetical protein
VHGSRATPKPRNPMGQRVNASVPVGDFPIGKSAHAMSWFTCHHKSPNPELRYARALIPRHVTSSLHSIGNRGIAISPVAIPLHCKTPNAESRLPGISCHLSPSDQRLRLDREIANRDFNKYETLASGKPDKPNPDGSWFSCA